MRILLNFHHQRPLVGPVAQQNRVEPVDELRRVHLQHQTQVSRLREGRLMDLGPLLQGFSVAVLVLKRLIKQIG